MFCRCRHTHTHTHPKCTFRATYKHYGPWLYVQCAWAWRRPIFRNTGSIKFHPTLGNLNVFVWGFGMLNLHIQQAAATWHPWMWPSFGWFESSWVWSCIETKLMHGPRTVAWCSFEFFQLLDNCSFASTCTRCWDLVQFDSPDLLYIPFCEPLSADFYVSLWSTFRHATVGVWECSCWVSTHICAYSSHLLLLPVADKGVHALLKVAGILILGWTWNAVVPFLLPASQLQSWQELCDFELISVWEVISDFLFVKKHLWYFGNYALISFMLGACNWQSRLSSSTFKTDYRQKCENSLWQSSRRAAQTGIPGYLIDSIQYQPLKVQSLSLSFQFQRNARLLRVAELAAQQNTTNIPRRTGTMQRFLSHMLSEYNYFSSRTEMFRSSIKVLHERRRLYSYYVSHMFNRCCRNATRRLLANDGCERCSSQQ